MTRHTENFDAGWRFCSNDALDDLSVRWTGAEQELLGFDRVAGDSDCVNWLKAGRSYGPAARDFDDSAWRTLALPHDWSVEHTPRPEDHPRNGFLRSGIVWYRKALKLNPADVGDDRYVGLRFDGVYRDAIVFVNGHLVGRNASGYIGFACDISDVVEPGENQIAVRVDGRSREGWFYEGTGIYRHVWLQTGSRLRVSHDGVRIDSTVADPTGRPWAKVTAHVELENGLAKTVQAEVVAMVLCPTGETVAEGWVSLTVAPGDRGIATVPGLQVDRAKLWSLEERHRYHLHIDVMMSGQAMDSVEQPFGLRTIRFDAQSGFFLNERPVKLKGVCCHQDHAGVGMAIPDGLQRWRLERLVEMGCNAYRTAHHAPTPELLDLCDELGILVMDEVRCFGVSDEAMSQLERTIRRDRNHPSVVMWSLANEEMAVQATNVGRRMFARLRRAARLLDDSRPFTAGVNNEWDKPTGFAEVEDVHGINYLPNGSLETLRSTRPDLPIVVAEASSEVSTRGEYVTDPPAGTVADYDNHTEPDHDHVVNWPFWGQASEPSWKTVARHDYISGTFVWTGFDYRGEQSPYVRWPSVGSHFGIMDLCGFPKDRFYYYQAWWSDREVLHLLPHWTWPGHEGQIVDVWAYTNCRAAELFVNGVSVGYREVEPNGHVEWKVEYEPGFIEVVGRRADGREFRTRRETAASPQAIRLRREGVGAGTAIVTAEIVDGNGHLVPHADNMLRFEASDGVRILGLGNGDPNSHEPDTPHRGLGMRRTFHGLAQVILDTSRVADEGEASLIATADGLLEANLNLVSGRSSQAANVSFVSEVSNQENSR